MRFPGFKVGDWVIYRKQKHSASPGRRAINIAPSPHGEVYSYFIDKFWIVQEVHPDGRLQLQTRKGKTHLINASDPNLRRAAWWQRWLHKGRFQAIEAEIKGVGR